MSWLPSFSEIRHWWRVASRFWPWEQAFWVALFHDTVEDGYLPKRLLKWPALDAVTRREGEIYADYIKRVDLHPVGRRVKLSDLFDNLSRRDGTPKKSRNQRYVNALLYLTTGDD